MCPARFARPSPSGLTHDAGGLHVAGIRSDQGIRRRAALRRPLVRARRRRARGARRPQRRGQVDAAAAAGGHRPARPWRGGDRQRRAHRLAGAGGARPGGHARRAARRRARRGVDGARRAARAGGAAGGGRCVARHAGALRAGADALRRAGRLGRWRPRSTRRAARWPSTTSIRRRRWRGSRAASRRAPCWPARCWPDPTVLLLDEPTNHLDGDGLRWLEDWLLRLRRHGARRLARPGVPRRGRRLHPRARARWSAHPLRGRLQRVSSAARGAQGEAGPRLRGPGEATTTARGRHRDDAPPGAAHRAHREPRRRAQAQALRQEGGQEGQGARGPAAARARGRPRGDAAGATRAVRGCGWRPRAAGAAGSRR